MRKILFDTNVILDVLLDRQPYAQASAGVWSLVEIGAAKGLVAAHAVTTIHYLVRKSLGDTRANRTVGLILKVFSVAPVTGVTIQEALDLRLGDFEDAVTAAAARAIGCDWIVTRDLKGFRGSQVRAITPDALAPLLKQ
jgi:predicted nucleic acid-binding protein